MADSSLAKRTRRTAALAMALASTAIAAFVAARPSIAHAEETRAASTVMVFVDPAEAGDDVARALGPDARVVPSKKLGDAVTKRVPKGKLHATLGDPAKKQSLADALRGADLGVDRLVVLSIKPTKGGGREIRALSVTLRGPPARGESVVVLSAGDDRVDGMRRVLGVDARTASPPGSGAAPPEPAQPPVEPGAKASGDAAPKRDDAARSDEGEPKHDAGPPDVTRAIVSAFAGLELTARRLSYTDALSSNVRPYDVTGAPSPAGGVELYPLARTSVPFLRDLGLVAAGATAVGLTSRVPDGERVATRFVRYELGLRYRLRLDTREHPAALGFEASYSGLKFQLTDRSALGGSDPSVNDRYLRFGLDGRVPLGPLVLLARVGIGRFLAVTPMGDQFPRGRGGIVDGRIGLGVPLGAVVEARLWLDHTRAFFDFRPQPGDAFVAGGAVDSYSTIHLDGLVHFLWRRLRAQVNPTRVRATPPRDAFWLPRRVSLTPALSRRAGRAHLMSA